MTEGVVDYVINAREGSATSQPVLLLALAWMTLFDTLLGRNARGRPLFWAKIEQTEVCFAGGCRGG